MRRCRCRTGFGRGGCCSIQQARGLKGRGRDRGDGRGRPMGEGFGLLCGEES